MLGFDFSLAASSQLLLVLGLWAIGVFVVVRPGTSR